MATATTSTTATGPAATYLYTEFGTSETGTPDTYGWLGADQVSSNALGGQMLMGARAYNANTGRFSQTDPVPGGSANAYDYALQNPLNNTDLGGTNAVWYSCTPTTWRNWTRTCTAYYNESTVRYIKHHMEYAFGWATLCGAFASGALGAFCWALDGIAGLIYAEADTNDDGRGEYMKVWQSRSVYIWWCFGERHWDSSWWPDWAAVYPG
jgi:RHS repeat-associated protein